MRAEIKEFSDGSLSLMCGDRGMVTDLVFASGARRGDPDLETQREILDWIVRKCNAAAMKTAEGYGAKHAQIIDVVYNLGKVHGVREAQSIMERP